MLSNIDIERAKRGISQATLCEMLGISVKTYYNYVNEKKDIPSAILIKLSKLFDTSTDYLLAGSDYMKGG